VQTVRRVSAVLAGISIAGVLATGSVTAGATSSHAAALQPTADGIAIPGHAIARTLPVFEFGSTRGQRRPHEIDFSGDSGNIVTNLRWSTWTSSQATASGRSLMQGCVPDCATGAEIMAPTSLTLRDPVDGYFTRIIERRDGQNAIWVYNRKQTRSAWPDLREPTASGPVVSLESYWGDIDTSAYAKAWTYLSRAAGTETAFIKDEQEAQPTNIELFGTLAAIAGNHTTIDINRLVTHDRQYGCRSWSGYYDMFKNDGRWVIANARIAPKAC
jgi:hypothetical protein